MSAITAPEARELSPEEQQDRAEECFKLEASIKADIAKGRQALMSLSRHFYDFNEAQGWSALGYEKQEDWLAQPDIGFTRTQFFRLVRRHRELSVYRHVPDAKLLELDSSKLDIVMPIIEGNKAKLDDVLNDVETLGARDLREKYIGTRAAPPTVELEGDDDVIETDAKPVKASSNGKAETKEQKQIAKAVAAAAAVDSWIDLGGDRRKAQRGMPRFIDDHPFFKAVALISACVASEPLEGQEEAPSRDAEDVKAAWELIVATLKLSFDEV